MSGTKHDSGKVMLELLPFESLEQIAQVLTFGAKKYAAHNWRGGFAWSRLLGACLRHLFAWARGQDNDPESGLSHLAHAGCCILFLIAHVVNGYGEDDRHKEPRQDTDDPGQGYILPVVDSNGSRVPEKDGAFDGRTFHAYKVVSGCDGCAFFVDRKHPDFLSCGRFNCSDVIFKEAK